MSNLWNNFVAGASQAAETASEAVEDAVDGATEAAEQAAEAAAQAAQDAAEAAAKAAHDAQDAAEAGAAAAGNAAQDAWDTVAGTTGGVGVDVDASDGSVGITGHVTMGGQTLSGGLGATGQSSSTGWTGSAQGQVGVNDHAVGAVGRIDADPDTLDQVGLDAGGFYSDPTGTTYEGGLTTNIDGSPGQVGVDAGGYAQTDDGDEVWRGEAGVTANFGSVGEPGASSGGLDVGGFAETFVDGEEEWRGETGITVGGSSISSEGGAWQEAVGIGMYTEQHEDGDTDRLEGGIGFNLGGTPTQTGLDVGGYAEQYTDGEFHGRTESGFTINAAHDSPQIGAGVYTELFGGFAGEDGHVRAELTTDAHLDLDAQSASAGVGIGNEVWVTEGDQSKNHSQEVGLKAGVEATDGGVAAKAGIYGDVDGSAPRHAGGSGHDDAYGAWTGVQVGIGADDDGVSATAGGFQDTHSDASGEERTTTSDSGVAATLSFGRGEVTAAATTYEERTRDGEPTGTSPEPTELASVSFGAGSSGTEATGTRETAGRERDGEVREVRDPSRMGRDVVDERSEPARSRDDGSADRGTDDGSRYDHADPTDVSRSELMIGGADDTLAFDEVDEDDDTPLE